MKHSIRLVAMVLTILFYGCSDKGTLEPEIVDEVYKLNLYQDSFSIYGYTIKWNKETTSLVCAIDGGSSSDIENPESGTKVFTNKDPGTREELTIDATDSEKNVRDTILVFTSPLEAVTWEDNSISGSSDQNTLNILTSHDISELDFYVAELGSQDLSNPPTLAEEDSWEVLTPDNFNNYTHDKPRDAYYAYTVRYTDSHGSHRFSTIEADIGISSNFKESSTLAISATTLQRNRIYISWDSYTGDDFYSYEVWRSNQEGFSVNDEDAVMLLEISDPSTVRFEDRGDIGTGTWYYRVVLQNIFGKIKTSSAVLGRAGI